MLDDGSPLLSADLEEDLQQRIGFSCLLLKWGQTRSGRQ